jgi:hypothetical protein
MLTPSTAGRTAIRRYGWFSHGCRRLVNDGGDYESNLSRVADAVASGDSSSLLWGSIQLCR